MSDAAPGARVRSGRSPGAFLAVLVVLGSIFFLRAAQEVLVPIVLAGLTFAGLAPLVDRLERLRIGRALGATLVLGALLLTFFGVLFSLNDEAVAALEELPRIAERVRATLHRDQGESLGTLDRVQAAAAQIEATAEEALGKAGRTGEIRVRVDDSGSSLTRYLLWGSTGVLAFAAQAVLVLLLAFFLLVGGAALKRKLVRAAGSTFSRRRITVEVLDDIGAQIERFLRGMALSSALVALATWGALAALGVERAAFWGVAAGALNTVPYVGAWVATAGILGFVYVQSGSLPEATLAAGAALAITLVESLFLTPWLMGRAARMNQIAVFVSLLFWGWLWGFWGVLLATPMTMLLKAIADHVEEWGGVAELLGD